jgi:hypothetical protein
MWFYPVMLVLVILALAGGTLAGGIYTIVLVPLAMIALVSAVVYAIWGRALQGSAQGTGGGAHAGSRPLPHNRRRPSGRAPSSPERLADARRRQQ